MPYTLSLLKNWASESGQSILGIPFNVKAQKIDGTMLNTYGLVVATFSLINKVNQSSGMLSITLSGANIDFID